jgi:hypothetical protein
MCTVRLLNLIRSDEINIEIFREHKISYINLVANLR